MRLPGRQWGVQQRCSSRRWHAAAGSQQLQTMLVTSQCQCQWHASGWGCGFHGPPWEELWQRHGHTLGQH